MRLATLKLPRSWFSLLLSFSGSLLRCECCKFSVLRMVDAGIRDIERVGSLELFLQQETEIAQDSLNGTQTPSIYVFNKYYLDLPVDDVPRELRVDAVLHVQPPIEGVAGPYSIQCVFHAVSEWNCCHSPF
ncbi:hypothetical protein C8R45DRAFT_545211 [Mycena sanguinolenta]|nr:hypothetical protein C8R45DRAFT_545211 [Mycena sanguinolenta]